MAAVNYIWEKVSVAVECLCGNGTFEERLCDAYVSSLSRLDSKDPPAELAADLNWVLTKCKQYLVPGADRMGSVTETDRRNIAKKLVHVLIETSRNTGDVPPQKPQSKPPKEKPTARPAGPTKRAEVPEVPVVKPTKPKGRKLLQYEPKPEVARAKPAIQPGRSAKEAADAAARADAAAGKRGHGQHKK
jgi:hypothetical protein